MKMEVCPICGCSTADKHNTYDPMAVFYSCPVCGRYEYTETEIMRPSLDKNRMGSFLYYRGFRNTGANPLEYRYFTTLPKERCDEYVAEFKKGNNTHGHPVHIDNEIINAWYPRSFAERINLMLLKLDEISDYIGQELILSRLELYGLTFVERYKRGDASIVTEEEMNRQAIFYLDYLVDAGYVDSDVWINEDHASSITITAAGYQRIDQLQRDLEDGRDAFVAMKFGNDTELLRAAIKRGITEAGYNPILIDEVEHNELITPELLSHIKNSKFVVVDLSHQNNGAYFEEGYALGLGKNVIQLCKKGTQLHFDIAQKNTIIWETESDIPLRLTNRIKATVEP